MSGLFCHCLRERAPALLSLFQSIQNKLAGINKSLHTVNKADLCPGVQLGTGFIHTLFPTNLCHLMYELLKALFLRLDFDELLKPWIRCRALAVHICVQLEKNIIMDLFIWPGWLFQWLTAIWYSLVVAVFVSWCSLCQSHRGADRSNATETKPVIQLQTEPVNIWLSLLKHMKHRTHPMSFSFLNIFTV